MQFSAAQKCINPAAAVAAHCKCTLKEAWRRNWYGVDWTFRESVNCWHALCKSLSFESVAQNGPYCIAMNSTLHCIVLDYITLQYISLHMSHCILHITKWTSSAVLSRKSENLSSAEQVLTTLFYIAVFYIKLQSFALHFLCFEVVEIGCAVESVELK